MKDKIDLPSTLRGSAASNRPAATSLLNHLFRTAIFVLLAFLCLSAHAQSGEWGWMGGSNTAPYAGVPGVYGKQGTPATGNIPGSRYSSSAWTGADGHLWLFGGASAAAGALIVLNDLWEFNPANNQWAWIGGSQTAGQSGVYLTPGTAASGNIVGARMGASTWTDSTGNLWLFGGYGVDGKGISGYLNDLWEFNPTANEWTWISGSSSVGAGYGQSGVYGKLGTAAAGNTPGGRSTASSWIDSGGHLWLFGGYGFDATGNRNYLNDVWKFDPSTTEWTWIGGSSTAGQSGTYGTLKTHTAGTIPGARFGASAGLDSSGHLWLFGGNGLDAKGNMGDLNDVWEFNPSLNDWTWMGGTNSVGNPAGASGGQPGVYGTLGTAAAGNIPGARQSAASFTDDGGNLWLLGGQGYDANGTLSYLNDLWEFNPSANEWTWMGGSSTTGKTYITGRIGVYGTLGKPAAGNIPGGREEASSWTDASGHFWLFSGVGFDSTDLQGNLNDLWQYLSQAATPTFSEPGATYTSTQTVTLADATSGATIYYTLDGTSPSSKSAKYASALSIAKTTTVKAIAEATGSLNSAVASATYSILKAQTIAFTSPTSPVTYGVKPITLSATATSGLAVKFSVVSGPATVSGATLTITGGGTVVVAANQSGNTTYAAAPQVTHSITVNKAKLTVTANNLSMKKGATVPTLTYSITGFVNNDTQAKATTGKPALSTTATAQSATGSYPITVKAGTLAAANYTFTLVNGKLTVN